MASVNASTTLSHIIAKLFLCRFDWLEGWVNNKIDDGSTTAASRMLPGEPAKFQVSWLLTALARSVGRDELISNV